VGFIGFRWLIFVLACLIASVIFIVRGFGVFSSFAVAILLALSWSIPSLWLRWRVEGRQQQINHSLPDLMDRISLGLEAGLGFEMALRRTVGKQRDLLGDELELVLGMLDRGHTKSEALDRLVRRNPSPDLRAFAAAVKQSERLGTPLKETLKVQGDILRSHRRRRAQEASRRLPILIVFPLVFFFLPALLIVYLGPPLLHLLLNR
jgi:tight adherence protein C